MARGPKVTIAVGSSSRSSGQEKRLPGNLTVTSTHGHGGGTDSFNCGIKVTTSAMLIGVSRRWLCLVSVVEAW